jgi:hypothetical protein
VLLSTSVKWLFLLMTGDQAASYSSMSVDDSCGSVFEGFLYTVKVECRDGKSAFHLSTPFNDFFCIPIFSYRCCGSNGRIIRLLPLSCNNHPGPWERLFELRLCLDHGSCCGTSLLRSCCLEGIMRMTREGRQFERSGVRKDLLLYVVAVAIVFLACGLRVRAFLADERLVGGGCGC